MALRLQQRDNENRDPAFTKDFVSRPSNQCLLNRSMPAAADDQCIVGACRNVVQNAIRSFARFDNDLLENEPALRHLIGGLRAKLFNALLDLMDEIRFALLPEFINIPVSQQSDQQQLGIGGHFFNHVQDRNHRAIGFGQAGGIIESLVGVFG